MDKVNDFFFVNEADAPTKAEPGMENAHKAAQMLSKTKVDDKVSS